MKKNVVWIFILICSLDSFSQKLPEKNEVLANMRLANDYFMKIWPDPSQKIVLDKVRTSNLWTRGIYYEGLMDFYKIDPDKKYIDYAIAWGEGNKWATWFGVKSRHADSHCCGITYIDLYQMDTTQKQRLAEIKASIDLMLASDKVDDWSWIDALQMAMPVFAKLGVMYNDERYFEKMHQLYLHSKNIEGGGLYNAKDGLWYRDKGFVPPFNTPNGKQCHWSRGNGWVVAAMVKMLEILPKNAKHYKEYEEMYLTMMKSLLPLQRKDGFWNVSLSDPNDFGGPELSGTALFAYGMAWGINNGYLSKKTYIKPTLKAWDAMNKTSLHSDGMLGYVQSTGKEPKDGQPLSFEKKANFEDYGLGCYLLAGTQVYLLK
ncbi:MAG: glycoside hydrolase family 88 protein [Cytophagaceae bacterium]|nr:glycoside hydrolase family 88 protein [Cytophagaceae bacterium]MBL0301180.1 glycoside hydrolase family 88 protein [Cytophagaceae bacterium]MBL0323997.1 glycoside hydrolase family 88 protein [Cytophagaceae bacterium]